MFVELENDKFYKKYKKYDACVIDYCILKCDEYKGMKTHKKAVLYFMNKLGDYIINEDKLRIDNKNSKDIFYVPDNYKELQYNMNTNDYHRPYWYLFLCPPHGTNYDINDFNKINDLLFPKGKEDIKIYDWTVNWSDYFEDGLEWWGARCISIYDKQEKRFILIFASTTD